MRYFGRLWLVLLASVGCSEPTEVFLVLNAHECIQAQIARIEVTVQGEDGLVHEADISLRGPSAESFPFQIPLVPLGGDASRRFSLEVRAFDDADAAVTTLHHEDGFVLGQAVERQLTLGGGVVGGGAPNRQPLIERRGTFESTSEIWEDVPGATIELDAGEGDAWMLLVSAQVKGDLGSAAFRLIEQRGDNVRTISFVDGTSAGRWTNWANFDWTVGGGTHRYQIQTHGDSANSAEIRDIALVAMPLSGESGLAAASGAATHYVGEGWSSLLRVCPEAGEYLVIGGVQATELDLSTGAGSGSGVSLRMTAGDAVWPEDAALENNRGALRSFLWARRHTVSLGDSIHLEALANSGTATATYPRIALIRIDDLLGVDSVLDNGLLVASERTVVSSLDTAPAAGTRYQVTIQGMNVRLPSVPDLRAQESRVFFGYDMVPPETVRVGQTVAGKFSAAAFDVLEESASVYVFNAVAPDDMVSDPLDVRASGSYIHVIHY